MLLLQQLNTASDSGLLKLTVAGTTHINADMLVRSVNTSMYNALDAWSEDTSSVTFPNNAFDVEGNGNFDALVYFLSHGHVQKHHPLYEDQKSSAGRQRLANDASNIFPSFLEFLREKYFSVNESIPRDIMIVLGKVPLENGTGEDLVELVRTRPRAFLEFVRWAYLAKSIPIPSNIQQLVEEAFPPRNNDNRDKSVSESEERNEELKRYGNEERIRLKTNPIVQQGILDYVKARNEEVMSSRCSDQYNTLAFNLFLLWADPEFSLMKSVYSGKFDEIEALLADSSSKIGIFAQYMQELQNMDKDKQWEVPGNFASKLQDHIHICETLNKLALTLVMNFEDRRISLQLGNILRSNIDSLLEKIRPFLNEQSRLYQELDNLSGRAQGNFARGGLLRGVTVREIGRQGGAVLNELKAAFKRQKGANFWWRPEREEGVSMMILGEFAVELLTMIQCIEALPDSNISHLPQKKDKFITHLVDIYNFSTKRTTYASSEEVIDDFIQNGLNSAENDFPIETVYNLVCFDDTIPLRSLVDLMRFFLENDARREGHSYEKYAIKTTAQIIRRLHNFGDWLQCLDLIEEVNKSLKQRDISRYVLNYSKVYLALALYYIKSPKTAHIEHAKECFIHYKSLTAYLDPEAQNPQDIKDEEKFYTIVGRILLWMDDSAQNVLPWMDSFLETGGRNTMKEAMKAHRVLAISEIEKVLSDMIASMTGDGDINRIGVSFWKDIEKRIAKTIFYNICTVEIRCGSRENVPKKREYETREILLNSDSSIVFTYPLSSEKLFDRIFSQYQDLIKQDIGNLIAIYNAKMELERKNRELELTNAKLEVTAFHDPKTWLFNKNKLKEDLEAAEKDNIPKTVLLIEVPDYDTIINTAGGSKKWSARMKQAKMDLERENLSLKDVSWEGAMGTIYRQSDSGFAIVFECRSGMPEQFTNTLKGLSFSFYMGAAVWETEDILPKANIALSKAIRDRKQGDHALKIFSPEDQVSLDTLNKNTEILRQALDENNEEVRLVPYYQPICDKDGKLVKYEALARIEKKEENERITIIPPWCFIKIAEEIGRSADITKAMLLRVSKDITEDKTIDVSVNMDAQSWNNREVMKKLEEICQYGFSDRVTVEILETVELNREDDKMQVEHLKSLGLALAIDDYGTWQSGPERVVDVGGQFIKIDMKTVKRLEDEETIAEGIKLIKNAVSLAKDLGMKTVAEWIESKEVFELLKDCGVDLFQWYYFSPPLPLEKLRGIRVFPQK